MGQSQYAHLRTKLNVFLIFLHFPQSGIPRSDKNIAAFSPHTEESKVSCFFGGQMYMESKVLKGNFFLSQIDSDG